MTEATLTPADLEAWKQEFMRDLQGRFAPMTTADDVQRLQGWRKKMEADGSFGRIFNGPQWLDGVAIRDGVISGAKLKADLVISNTFRTNDPTTDPTGDRMELDNAGLRWYGTVSGVANTKIVDFSPSGFEIGNGSNKISYVASTGVLTVPAAVITSLTIASVGSGILGGTYKTSNATARLELSTSGILAYNSSGTNTFNLAASSGDLTITGTFTIQSATSAARVEIKQTGIKIYDSGGTLRAQLLNDGSGFIGSTSGLSSSAAVSWTTGGSSTINATSISTGSLNGGLLSGGSVGDSAIASIAANKITAGSGIIANLTVSSTLTLGSGGKIIDADGSYWDQTGINLKSSGSFADAIVWKVGASSIGSIYADASNFLIYANTGKALAIGALSGAGFNLSSSGILSYGKTYPGYGSTTTQLTYYIDAGAGGIITNGVGIYGDLGIASGFTLNLVSPGTGGSANSWSSFTVANVPDKNAGYFKIRLGGTFYRVPFYVDA